MERKEKGKYSREIISSCFKIRGPLGDAPYLPSLPSTVIFYIFPSISLLFSLLRPPFAFFFHSLFISITRAHFPPVFFLLFLLTGNFRQWNITFNSTKKQAFLFSCSAKIRETCDSEGPRLEAAAAINIPFDLSIRRISAIVGPPSENKSNRIPLSFFLSLPLKIDR